MLVQNKVVHLIPSGVFENTYHGSYKDVISRVRWFERSGCDYRQFIVNADELTRLQDHWSEWDQASFLIEYSYFPKIIRELRKRQAGSLIAVRSHNIEPMQHLHNHGWYAKRGPAWVGYGMARLFWGDLIVKQHADVIYCISDWEKAKYWRRLPGRARVEWLPYFCPEHLIAKNPQPSAVRKVIACMPTSVKSRKSFDLVATFIRFAETAKRLSSGYEFVITGNLQTWPAPESNAVRYTGMINDLADFLGSVRAVCILSDLGYGFKTTIADAMANDVEVLVHERLKSRFSCMLGDRLVEVDSSKPASVQAALEQLSRGRSSLPEINKSLQRHARRILNHDFRLDLRE